MRKGIALFLCGLLSASAVVASSSVTALAAPKIDPYSTVQAELNFGREGVVQTPEVYNGQKITTLSSVEAGDYWLVKDVDFSEGLSKISLTAKADTPSVIEVRDGGVDGDVLANFKIGDTKGEFKTITYTVKKSIEGKHTLAFVGAIGDATADYWIAEKAEATVEPTPTPTPVYGDVNPYETVEAENSAEMKAAIVAQDGDVTYTLIRSNGYVCAKNVDFSNGLAAIVATGKAYKPAVLEVRVDAPDGELLSNIMLSAGDFTTKTIKVNMDLSGKHDLYFVAALQGATVLFDSWKVMAPPVKPNPEEPVVDPEEPVVTDKINPYTTVEAEDATIMEKLDVKTADGRTYVERLRPRVTYVVKNVEFDGASKIAITYKSDCSHVLEIHDGDTYGPRLAFLNIPCSDYEWTTVYLNFPDLHGNYDLYFVPKHGVIDFDSWSILKDGQEEPEPVDPEPVDPTPVDPEPVDPTPVDPEPEDPTPVDPQPVAKGLTTEYSLNNWGSGYQVSVKVTNGSSQKAEDWVVKINKNDVGIDASWNVNITEEGDYYVVTPVEWNRVIEAGSSVEFGFQGSSHVKDAIEIFAEGEVKDEPQPEDPTPVDPEPVDPTPVDPEPVDPEPVDPTPVDPEPVVVNDDLALDYTVNGQGSFTINMAVVNNGKSTVNTWTLKLKKSQLTIDNSWCVKVATEGDYYVITPESWNATINAGGSAFFGIQGTGTFTTLDYILE